MAAMNTREMLQHEIESLPDALAEEVFDFVMFVKARREEEAFLWEQAETAQAHRRAHPDEVITSTAEEWDAATKSKTDE